MGGCLRECDGEVLNVGNKTRLAEIFFFFLFFFLTPALKASGNLSRSLPLKNTEEGSEKRHGGGLTLSRPPLHFVGGEDTAR